VQQKLRNELPKICQLLAPYKANLKIVVESTFNWYWLIDGLQAEGFEVVLAHTLGLYLITGAKVKTDRRDAYSLAKLLLVGAVPAAYIYPVETRPNLTGVTCELAAWCAVNPSIMSEAGDGTVELLVPVLSSHFRTT